MRPPSRLYRRVRPYVHRHLLWLVPALLAFFAADAFWGRWLIWSPPDETAWESAPLYHFEYEFRRLESSRQSGGPGPVLLFGSSIAAYGFLPERMRRKLSTSSGVVRPRPVVRLLARQGLNALYLEALTGRILALRPSVVVVPVNMVDFRLERPLMLGLMGRLQDDGTRQRLARDLLADRGFLRHAPGGVLRCCFGQLDLNGKAAAIFASGIAAYRYRDIAPVGLSRFLANRLRKGRSYLHYAGVPVLGGNVTWRGRTGRTFGLRVTSELLRTGLEFEAPGELLRSAQKATGGAPVLTLDVRLPGAGCGNSRIRLRSARFRLRRGWQNVALQGPGTTLRPRVGETLCGRVNVDYVSEVAADRLTLRLARNTGRPVSELRGAALRREVRREDLRYRAMGRVAYERSFRRRVLRFDRRGMEYLHALKLARDAWRHRAFDETLPTARGFEQFRKRLGRAGVRLLIINAPENEISLRWYETGRWYRGYLDFLARSSGRDGYRFVDARRLLPMQFFYDYHHLSYFGAERFTDFTVQPLGRLLALPQTGR